MSEDDGARPRRSATALWLMLALSAAPIAASYFAYYFWRPSALVNYGELIGPLNLADARLTSLDGGPIRIADFRGVWVLLATDSAACDERCREKLVYIRQIRLAAGKEKERVERLWVVADRGAPQPALVTEHPGLAIARDDAGAVVPLLPAVVSPADHIYVIDPLGNLMMRFPRDPDPRKMLKDVSRLLRHSKWK